jgi:hypothetical protein
VESSFLYCLVWKDVLVHLRLRNFCEMEFIFLWIISMIFALLLSYPGSERTEPKLPYMFPRCSNHMYD